MKRVLIVFTTQFTSYDGATCVMMNYYRYMSLDNIQIDFACSNILDNDLQNELNDRGSLYYQLPSRTNLFSYFFHLYRILKGYDILHVNGNSATSALELWSGILAGTITRIAHNHNTSTRHPFIHSLLLPLFKRGYTKALACSNAAGDWIFGINKYSVLNNAIDIDKYLFSVDSRRAYRKILNIDDDTVVLGHVGRFNEQKNHKKLLRVFKQYNNKHKKSCLLLVGDGPNRQKINEWIQELNIVDSVIMLGQRTDVPQLFSAMDVFVFPSKWEGLGLAIIEAQTSGLPCLVSDCVPNDVVLSDRIDLISIQVDEKEWVEKIEDLLGVDRIHQSHKNKDSITSGGYNIKKEARKLKEMYIQD